MVGPPSLNLVHERLKQNSIIMILFVKYKEIKKLPVSNAHYVEIH